MICSPMALIQELKRRKVLRAGVAQVILSSLAIPVVETDFPPFVFGDAAVRVRVNALAILIESSLLVISRCQPEKSTHGTLQAMPP